MKNKKIISLFLFCALLMTILPAYSDAFTDLMVKQMITLGVNERMIPSSQEKLEFMNGITVTPYTTIESIQEDLNQGSNINKCNNMKATPIAVAAGIGREDLVEFLIKHGAELNITIRPNSQSALMFACISGKSDILKLLLGNGANPNLKDKSGAILTHYITLSNNKESIELILKNCGNINATDNDGLTPLDWAILGEKTVAVKVLLEQGSAINTKSSIGLTPLDYANISENQYIITLLKNLNAKSTGQYGVDTLARVHCIAIPGGLKNIDIVLKTGHTKEIKYLLSTNKMNLAEQMNSIATAQKNRIAEKKSEQQMDDKKQKNSEEQIYCIKEFKPYSSIIPDSFTEAHVIAAFNRDPKAVDTFFKETGSINIKDRHGITPLMAAAYLNPNVEVIKVMIKDGAELNDHDNSHAYPLGYARLQNNFKVIDFLLEQNLSKPHIRRAIIGYYKDYSPRSQQSNKEIDKMLINTLRDKSRGL